MDGKQVRSKSMTRMTIERTFSTLFTLAVSLAIAMPAEASFVGHYQLSNFLLTNTGADGVAISPDGGLSVVLTGGNTGSGEPGTTDLTIASPVAGLVAFTFLYSSLDLPTFDYAGYLLGSNFLQFADTDGQSATISFPVIAGEIFGFRVGTFDNAGEPGILTISNFQAPGQISNVPEPGTILFTLAGVGLLAMLRASRISRRRLPQMKRFVLVLLGAALLAPHAGFAQTGQAHYVGVNVTGQIVLARAVSARQASGQPQGMSGFSAFSSTMELLQGAGGLFSTFAPAAVSRERLPNIPPRRWRPATLNFGSSVPGRSGKASLFHTASLPITQTLTVNPSFTGIGFNGMTHLDQRNANNGNQFSVEPPNPGIAVANGYVVEGVNNAFQVYSTSGTPLLSRVLSTNELFGVPPAIDWITGVNGVFPTDMRVFYDHDINRWIVLQRAQDFDVFGNPLNQSHLYMAVSQSGDPTGTYNIYVMDTTDAQQPGCPCVADYPQIGADRYGFYISTNGFNTFSERFVNASILALSKDSLAAGASTPTAYRFALPFTTGYEFAIQPASTPPGASYFVANGGVEYFVSSQGTSSFSSNVAIWAMYNTASLRTSTPSLLLTQKLVPSLAYAFPDVATQRPGPLPYASTLIPPGVLSFIDGGDMRVLSVSYAGGRLWVTLSTNSTDLNGRAVVGAAYLILSPTFRAGVLAAPVLRQGYLVVTNNHILRPAIAVNAQSRGAIAFTLVGPDYYPSAAFVPIDLLSTSSVLQVPAFGAMPQDGFTGYPGGFGAGVARWGDYSAAVASGDGSIWMTSQYIPNAPRSEFANWGTFLYRYLP